MSYMCHYCGRLLPLQKITIDHKIPKWRGGTDDEANFVMSCGNCNREKDLMTEDEFEFAIKTGTFPQSFLEFMALHDRSVHSKRFQKYRKLLLKRRKKYM